MEWMILFFTFHIFTFANGIDPETDEPSKTEFSCDRKTWDCNETCISRETPCEDRCPTGLTQSCEGVCTKIYQLSTWSCEGHCRNISEPCGNRCANENIIFNCNGKCEMTNYRTNHDCNGQCLDMKTPCNEECPYYCSCPQKECCNHQWNCKGKCQNVETPCDNDCPSDHYLNCDGKCQSYHSYARKNWMCDGVCINSSMPCAGTCQHKSLYINCNGECESYEKRMVYKCSDKCLSFTEPCKGQCLENCLDQHPCEKQFDCRGKCQVASLPCFGVCPDGYYMTCDGTCKIFLTDVFEQKQMPKMNWMCNSVCQSWQTPCNNSCMNEQMLLNCKGQCELNLSFHTCNKICQPITVPCYGKCPEKYNFVDGVCQSNVFEVLDECSDSTFDCARNICTNNPIKYQCGEDCQSVYEPCNNKCAKDYILSCNGSCIYKREAITSYVCDEECIEIDQPCRGQCQQNKILCGGSCVNIHGGEIFECDGKCTKDKNNCIDCSTMKSFTRFKTHTWSSCPNEKKCHETIKFCNNNQNLCLNGTNLSRDLCENPTKYNITHEDCGSLGKIPCGSHRNLQCINQADTCDGLLDCIDRSDEVACIFPQDHLNYSLFQDCIYHTNLGIVHGFKCNDTLCLKNDYWCDPTNEFENVFPEAPSTCSDLILTMNNQILCRNKTFWSQRRCQKKSVRCHGNYPGQCANKKNLQIPCKSSRGHCVDKSDLVCNHFEFYSEGICLKSFMKFCSDNITCIHQDLFCDGYLHCPDESDEDPNVCGQCPRDVGFPNDKIIFATFRCKHKYTKRLICAVPCDGEDDMCLNDEDENCQNQTSQLIYGIVFVFILAAIGVGELVQRALTLDDHEEPIHENIELLEILEMCNGVKNYTKKNKDRIVQKFVKLHNSQQMRYQINITYKVLEILEPLMRQIYTELLFNLEMECHKGNVADLNICLKDNLGPGKTKLLTSFKKNEVGIMSKFEESGKALLEKVWNGPRRRNLAARLGFIVSVVIQIGTYLLDLIKDIYIIILYSKFLPPTFNNFSTFSFQILLILGVSISLPGVLNLVIAIGQSPISRKRYKLILGLLAPIAPAISIYILASLEHRKSLECSHLRRDRALLRCVYRKLNKIEKLNSGIKEWKIFLSRMRSTENATENLIQTTLLLILIFLKFSKTSTISALQDFFVGNNTLLLAFSSTISFISITRGKLKEAVSTNEFIGTKGKMLILGVSLLSLICRVLAVSIFFAPAMGLFNLLGHWKMGKMNVKNSKIKKYFDYTLSHKVMFDEIWQPIESHLQLTWWDLKSYYIIFLVLLLSHFACMAIVKICFAPEYRKRANIIGKAFHILKHSAIPTPFGSEEDEEVDGEVCWPKVSTEMKATLVLFSGEHIVMCCPLFILAYNIYKRNDFLNEFFPQVPEELASTKHAYCLSLLCPIVFLVAPVVQYFLFKLYYSYGHQKPKMILQDKKPTRERSLKILFSSEETSETYFKEFWGKVEKEKKATERFKTHKTEIEKDFK